MLKTIILIISVSLFSSFSHAIRSVGNGGGEAELVALTQMASINIYLKFCKENNNDCFGQTLNSDQTNQFNNVIVSAAQIQEIVFVEIEEEIQTLKKNQLIVQRNNLYVNEFIRRSNLYITQVLINSIIEKNNSSLKLKLNLPADIIEINNELAYIQSELYDFLFFKKNQINLHKAVSKSLDDKNYKILSISKNTFILRTPDDFNTYKISYQIENEKLNVFKSVYID